MELTVIYYSSNREDPIFEGRIVENLLLVSGDLPIISVTQKPMDLGKNIVVGDVGASGFNCFRQILLACKEAKTKFVVSAEADCLYPPDYFQFIPPKDNVCYRNSNLYVMGDHRDFFWRKPEGATHSQIVGREFYAETLEKLFEKAPQWSVEEMNFPKERHKKEDVFNQIEYWQTPNPVIQIKTHRSLRYYTHSERKNIYTLPYWGSGKELRKKIMAGVKELYAS